jgi:hypothetical protein
VGRVKITSLPGNPNLLLGAYDLATLGYGAEEFVVSGTASSYASDEQADYTTRIVVCRPTDAASNGTVIVEWLNVSGGIDAPAVWLMAHREIARAGHAYVAVSAQQVGVEGGDNLMGFDMSLKAQDPERYSQLSHPGDQFSYDIYSQVGRLLRDGGIDGLTPESLIAVGESQSAMFLTTYVNEVDPLAKVFDGFLVHSRFGPAAPLAGGSALEESRPAPFSDDLRAPVLSVITETDLVDGHLLGYHHARRPDNDRLRVWEIPGTAHADNYTIRVGFIDNGSVPLDNLVAAYAPTNELMGASLSYHINFAPQHHYVLQAAIASLHNWVRTGEPAPAAHPIWMTDGDSPVLVLDEHELARGGVRTPWVDVPIARTSGLAPDESPMSFLFGTGAIFDDDMVRTLYPGGVSDYLQGFTEALDRAIEAGFIVAADRAEILEIAAATFPSAPRS